MVLRISFAKDENILLSLLKHLNLGFNAYLQKYVRLRGSSFGRVVRHPGGHL